MSVHSIDNAAHSALIRQIAAAGTAVAILFGVLGACSKDDRPTGPANLRQIYGPAQPLGSGTARSYVLVDAAGNPTTLGVALSESAMTGLPATPMNGTPSAAMLMLAPPAEARAVGYDHVMLDWNPQGHEPAHVYTLPHFDFHFYTISESAQMEIMPMQPRFAERASRLPADEYVPAGYISANVPANLSPVDATVPAMGLHWLDGAASELHGQTFTTTFLYGSFDGQFIFFEPMITKAYIESMKSAPGNALVAPVKLPARYERPGFYPTQYTIAWDGAAKEYRIALTNLVRRN